MSKVITYTPGSYQNPYNSIEYTDSDKMVFNLALVYNSTDDETDTYVAVVDMTDGDSFYIHGRSGTAGVIGYTDITTTDLTELDEIQAISSINPEYDSVNNTVSGTLLVFGISGGAPTSVVAGYDLTNKVYNQTLPVTPSLDVPFIGLIKDPTGIPALIIPKSSTEIVKFTGTEEVIINTTNPGFLYDSNNSQVIVVEEKADVFSQNELTTDLKVYEGYEYVPAEGIPSGPSLDFPAEENIYFFDNSDTLITELDVGQLSPIKDTDIYSVQIATNITTDTFESITLGTTENSVDCLLSSTEDPFEAVEQITIPFTNEDTVTVYLKLATDEVQTVGNASLELLVVGNLAT